MKCPKCGYLGFEHVERCRNCGFDFSLSPAVAGADLSIAPPASSRMAAADDFSIPDVALAAPVAPIGAELPLFEDEPPLITRPSPPRPPLAVRRSTPEVPRLRGQARSTTLDFGFDAKPAARAAAAVPAEALSPAVFDDGDLRAAGLGARLGATFVDLVILATVDLAVVYFTLQICGVTFGEFTVVPKAPLGAFLLVQNLGYLIAFNAGGQTLGKMAMGIRVVPADEYEGLDVSHAVVRTLVWVALAVPAGLGFLTTLLGRDHRGLHDRFAGTRVVRV